MSKRDQGNPNAIIQEKLTLLRAEREQAVSDIDSLELEKLSIQRILPKILYELSQLRESIDEKRKDLTMFESAIADIEKTYGDFIYSPDYFKA